MIKLELDHRMKRSMLDQLVDQLKKYHVESRLESAEIFLDYRSVAKANALDESLLEEAYLRLVKEGYLRHTKNRFTVFRLPFLPLESIRTKTIYETIEALQMTPSFVTLHVQFLPKLPSVFNAAIDPTVSVVKITRLYFADQIPLVYIESFYDKTLFKEFESLNLMEMKIFKYFQDTWQRRIGRHHQIIDIVKAPASINEDLNQPLDASVIRFVSKTTDQHGETLAHTIIHTSMLYAIESVNLFRPEKKAL
jgi:DNA-binding GntR family transcriptional regulator